MNFKVFIIEHRPFAQELGYHLEKWNYQIVGTNSNSLEVLEVIPKVLPDLILMSINLDGPYNGLEVANKIQILDIPIIFMTECNSISTYKATKNTNCIQYLVKPFNILTLKSTMEQYFTRQFYRKTLESNSALFVRKNKEILKIKVNEIDWMQTSRNYCVISSNGAKYALRKSMKEILSILPPEQFIRIHKSYAVRINAVTSFTLSKNRVGVGEDLLPIGKMYRTQFLEFFNHIS